MIDVLVALSMLIGALFMLLAAIGLLRMPDLPMRMHATTKAGALGSGLIMIAVALHFSSSEVTARVIAIIGFIMLTAPVAAHVIGRAGYFVGVPLWHKILQDDLKGKYDATTHTLRSPDIDSQDIEQPPRDH
jgi:multicomponent Na+:H+ antiporter subunit G